MRTILVALFLSLPLSGCLSEDGLTGLVDEASTPDFELPSTLYLHADGGLTATAATEDAVNLDWSWTEWFGGDMPPVWTGPSYPGAYVITEASATIQYRANSNLVHSDTRPPFTIWFGAGDSIVEHAFAPGPNPWMADDVQTITFDIDSLPVGGLVVPAGERPVLYVGTYYPDGDDQSTVSVLTGGSDASRLDWTAEPIYLPPARAETALDENGLLQGGRCVGDVNPGDAAMDTYEFRVDDDVIGLDVRLERESGAGIGPDLDFGVRGPSGDRIGGAAGPASPEALHLRLPNMEAIGSGTWSVYVYNCQQQASSYDLRVDVLLRD